MTNKRFHATVAHLVRKQTGLSLVDIDSDADVEIYHDSHASEREQALQAVAAADEILSENGFIDDDPAMTASIVACVMSDLIS
jgi:hypothetical protein